VLGTEASTQVAVSERDGRIYITITGPERYALGAALRRAFAGHHELYRCVDGRYRLWHRDRGRLERWLDVWCDLSAIEWEGR